MSLVNRKNDLLTVIIVKDVISEPTENKLSNGNFEISASLFSFHEDLPTTYHPNWRRFFRVHYFFKAAFWEDGVFKLEEDLEES